MRARSALVGGAALALLLAVGCATPRPGGAPRLQEGLWLPAVGQIPFHPSQLRGRVVLVTFVATWCFPCLGELPLLEHLHQTYADEGLQVLVVGMDLEGATVLEPFADHYQLPFPILVADDPLIAGESPFGKIAALPTHLLLGRDGGPLAGLEGPANPKHLATLIEEALARPTPR